jgi:hypothetical protein
MTERSVCGRQNLPEFIAAIWRLFTMRAFAASPMAPHQDF